MSLTAEQLYTACEATWPPASSVIIDGWTLRDGAGGGKRVSAATLAREGADPAAAEFIMDASGEDPLFMIRQGDGALDSQLALRGYEIIDPVVMYQCPVAQLTDKPIPKVTTFAVWEPLAIMEEIWAQGGIGPARLAVMHRAEVKTGIFGRVNDIPAGVAFAGLHDCTTANKPANALYASLGMQPVGQYHYRIKRG